jgi:hypothetical protein
VALLILSARFLLSSSSLDKKQHLSFPQQAWPVATRERVIYDDRTIEATPDTEGDFKKPSSFI